MRELVERLGEKQIAEITGLAPARDVQHFQNYVDEE